MHEPVDGKRHTQAGFTPSVLKPCEARIDLGNSDANQTVHYGQPGGTEPKKYSVLMHHSIGKRLLQTTGPKGPFAVLGRAFRVHQIGTDIKP